MRHIRNIIDDIGTDLRTTNLKDVRFSGVDILEFIFKGMQDEGYTDIVYTDIRNALLPYNPTLFQEIYNKDLSYVYLPCGDYTNYEFKDVILYKSLFSKYTKLPTTKTLFYDMDAHSIAYTCLPESDYSEMIFDNVNIIGVSFPKLSRLPNTKNFLQLLYDQSINGVKLPYGDYSLWDFENINIEGVTFNKHTVLSKRKDLLVKAKNSSCYKCVFINQDLSFYDFTNVCIEEAKFINCTFPKDSNLFHIIKNKNINFTTFVDCDISHINTCGVSLEHSVFSKRSKLHVYKNFFQDLQNKSAAYAKLPIADYSMCDFKDIDLSYCKIAFEAIMPTDINFFNNLNNGSYMSLTKNMLKCIDLYDLSNVSLNLKPYRRYLTPSQICILKMKYKEKISKRELII